MVSAICREITMRRDYLQNKTLESIYFGGGTPSLLDRADLDQIFDTLSKCYHWPQHVEITLEANPDDLTKEKIAIIQESGINRLSIGIQSFFDEDLAWMNRAHNASEALTSIKHAQDVGMDNITIDLIYGSPATTHEMWATNLAKALALDIPHISSYCLTVEEKTALHHHVKTGQQPPVDQEKSNQQFTMLMDTLIDHGYEHYEISNFARPGHHAVHNTNYWKGAHFMGIGPSAHSYDGISRSWNIANNKKYIDHVYEGKLPLETEVLTQDDQYNEYIMTGLRTIWGVDLEKIRSFGPKYVDYFTKSITKDLVSEYVIQRGNHYILTKEGKFFADRIAIDAFCVE